VLAVVGGARADDLLAANVRSNLSAASNYLDQVKSQANTRVSQLARSERLIELTERPNARAELDRHLASLAEGAGLDYLLVASADGRVIGSSTGVAEGLRVPESWVIRQARDGVGNVAYERFEGAQLAAFSPRFPEQARVPLPEGGEASRGLLINAAAHFPLSVRATDAILVGGMLLNRNFPLVEHMREVIFPVGSLPEEAEGMTSLHLDGVNIAVSRQRLQGQRTLGNRAPQPAQAQLLGGGQNWLGHIDIGGSRYLTGYTAIEDGESRPIGMIATGYPDEPFKRMTWLLLGMVAILLALTMLAISLLYLQAGRELTQRLARIARTMSQVRQGDRQARVGTPLRDDELGRLAQHFDVLLETIEAQDQRQRVAQEAIADEASRRRALFETERDGVVVLNADGSVLEANPKAQAMLGYSAEELRGLRLLDWDERLTRADIVQLIDNVGPEGSFFETVHRRRDGSTYAAEVSVSRAQWGERSFVFLLQRDISERKAVESELERYRAALESLVMERTRELEDRSEQLDAIFALSPDGFVSFDAERRVSFANRAFLRAAGLEADAVLGMDEAAFSELLQAACSENARFPSVAQLRAERQRLMDAQPSSQLGDEERGGGTGSELRRTFELLRPRRRVIEVGIRLAQADNVSQLLYFRDVTHETEVDRMKSEFLSTAAHELRTPMTSIYGFVQLLCLREFAPARRAELLGTIARQSELMITIINQLLDLARIEARRGQDFTYEALQLQDLVADVVAGYAPPAGREPPQLAVCAQPLTLRGDRQKLEQALLNIVANAYKYSPGGGAVEIGYRLGDHLGQEMLGVQVRDHGIGMTEEQRSHVCERFYRADASGNIPGTGLGMSIVKEIVELHHGEVEIASELGVGSTVTLWFPAWQPPKATAGL
ncbi:MAG TPA: PAS domain S-box protein, partial [Burkholderiaceae bacterium]|nr:PAS domain S-box protein [Burkholderiaceae bacterium]